MAGEIKISASLMCADWWNCGKQIRELEEAGVDMLHFDIGDGIFVPNIILGFPALESLRNKTSLPFDVHLMVMNPERYLDNFLHCGSQILTVHVESTPNLHRAIYTIKESGVRVGVALNPATPVSVLDYLFPELDLVLVMCVDPGFAGSKFVPSVVEKVRRLRQEIERRHLNLDIEVDGNINLQTVPLLSRAGANIFVGGSSGLFTRDKSFRQAVEDLKNCAQASTEVEK